MKAEPTKLVDGRLWPEDWSLRQCPYSPPGTDCDLGGSPCQLPNEGWRFLENAGASCEHAVTAQKE